MQKGSWKIKETRYLYGDLNLPGGSFFFVPSESRLDWEDESTLRSRVLVGA